MAITARSENRSTIDLEQASIHFISKKKNAQLLRLWSLWGAGNDQKAIDFRESIFIEKKKHLVLIKGCLGAPHLLTARVFFTYVPHFQWIWEMECFSPRIACLLIHPIQLRCLICRNRWQETKQMAGVAIFVSKSILHLDNQGVKKGNNQCLLVMIDWAGTYSKL